MTAFDERLRVQLDRLVPLPHARDADWADALRRSKEPRARRLAFRQAAFGLAAVAAAAAAIGLTPAGAAIARGVTDFSAWLRGSPGAPASREEQRAFDRENARSWAAFPGGPRLRRLLSTRVEGVEYELLGFRSAGSFCLRLHVQGVVQSQWPTACAPLRELQAADAPVLPLLTDYALGERASAAPGGYAPAAAAVTFGVVADGIRTVSVSDAAGRRDALVGGNSFLYVAGHPPVGARVRSIVAIDEARKRWTVPIAEAPFGSHGPPSRPGKPTGPDHIQRHLDDLRIGWIMRREPRGQRFVIPGLLHHAFAGLVFARAIQPDPRLPAWVGVGLAGHLPGPLGRDRQPGPFLCRLLVTRGPSGAGCSPLSKFFAHGPIAAGISSANGGDQYVTVDGLVADGVERLQLFLSTGERIAVPLLDNAFVAQVARTKFPARFVGYDDSGRVVAIETYRSDPLSDTGPRPVPGKQRVALRVRGSVAVLRVGPSTSGGTCWSVEVTGGAGSSGCSAKSGPRARLDTVGIIPAGDRFLDGVVGREVAVVDVTYPDGRRERVPTVDGYLLHPLAEPLEAGSTVNLTARDAAGKERARRSLKVP